MFSNTIMGIDPGSTYTGVGVINIVDNRIDSYYTHLIRTDLNIPPFRRVDKFLTLHTALSEIVEMYRPFEVCVESPFFYGARPTAVIPLAKTNGVIESVFYGKGYSLINKYAPLYIKKKIGVTDFKDKNSTRTAMESFDPIFDLTILSEHEVDALSVAVAHHLS